jgi:hypothetical protein
VDREKAVSSGSDLQVFASSHDDPSSGCEFLLSVIDVQRSLSVRLHNNTLSTCQNEMRTALTLKLNQYPMPKTTTRASS